MPNISVRKLDQNTYDQLCIRATEHGVSMEEEARQILSQTVAAPEKISAIFRKHFGPKNGVDLDELLPEREPHKPMDFQQ